MIAIAIRIGQRKKQSCPMALGPIQLSSLIVSVASPTLGITGLLGTIASPGAVGFG
jgi:hypothetical protein